MQIGNCTQAFDAIFNDLEWPWPRFHGHDIIQSQITRNWYKIELCLQWPTNRIWSIEQQHCQCCWTTPNPDFKVYYLIFIITGRRSAAMLVLFLLSGPKIGFLPQRATHCPDKRAIWHGGSGADRTSPPPCQISRLSGKNVGIQPQNSKFWILARNLYLWGDLFAVFLRNYQHLYASIGSF